MNKNELGDTKPGRANQQIAELGRDLIHVLHVEDDPNCREAIADQLSDHGFVVRSFADAMSLADGLAISSEADIILLDWDLPEISGIDLLVELRQVGVNLPVVFLTGYGFKAQENQAFETGAVDFIDKAGALKFWPGVCGVWSGRQNQRPLQPRPVSWSAASSSSTRMSAGHIGTTGMRASPWRVQHRPPLGVECGSLGDLSSGLRSRPLRRLRRRERRRRLSDKRSSNYQADTQKVPPMR